MNYTNHRCSAEYLRWLFSLESSTIAAQQAIKLRSTSDYSATLN